MFQDKSQFRQGDFRGCDNTSRGKRHILWRELNAA